VAKWFVFLKDSKISNIIRLKKGKLMQQVFQKPSHCQHLIYETYFTEAEAFVAPCFLPNVDKKHCNFGSGK
jgi:hypothetical protein